MLSIIDGFASWFGLAYSLAYSLLLVLTCIAYSFLLVLLQLPWLKHRIFLLSMLLFLGQISLFYVKGNLFFDQGSCSMGTHPDQHFLINSPPVGASLAQKKASPGGFKPSTRQTQGKQL